MKKLLTFISLILILNLDVKGQIFYNKYTRYNPYYGNSQTYALTDDDRKDRNFELGIIVMGVGLVTMLAATYDYTSYNYSYYGYYNFEKQTNMPMFYVGTGLTATGLIISLTNNKKKSKRNKDKDIFYEN